MGFWRLTFVVGLALGGTAAFASARNSREAADAIAASLAMPGTLAVDGVELDRVALHAAYEPRAFAPVWTDVARAKAIVGVLADAEREGLDPASYHVTQLQGRLTGDRIADPTGFDLLLTDAVVYYGTHVQRGRLVPPHPTPTTGYGPRYVEPSPLIEAIASAPDVTAHLAGLAPKHRAYTQLRDALARERAGTEPSAGPAFTPGTRTVRPGQSDDVVPHVRRRLIATGDFTGTASDDRSYDADLVDAVKRFQERSGLSSDGVLGPRTQGEMAGKGGGVPPTREERIARLTANMERWRWLPPDLGNPRIMVDIPRFMLQVVENEAVTLEMPVVVGTAKRATPTLSSAITQLVFNPAWYVPPKLVREDVWPKIARDPGYANAKGISISGLPRTETGEPDFSRGSGSRVSLRQAPGPANPLGRVKFLLPNAYAIYLHDTNSKGLMKRDNRAQSSGCIRLGDAMGLAGHLLANVPEWTEERIAGLTKNWQTRHVTLPVPVPVHLVYATVTVDADGTVHYFDDLYQRDADLAKAMGEHHRAATEGRKVRLALAPRAEPVYQAAASPGGTATAVDVRSTEGSWESSRGDGGSRSAVVETSSGSVAP